MATKTPTSKTKTTTNKVKAPVKKVETKPVAVKAVVNPVIEVVVAGKGRTITGKVISDKMMNTIVIQVTRLVAHPMYHKRMRRTNKFHAHDTMGAKIGNLVEVTECRPISKNKNFVVTKILK